MALVDKRTCESIQCGATTQLEAGMQLIMDCASAGYSGARSCQDPLCIDEGLLPTYCSPSHAVAIPFSPANVPNAPTLEEMHSPDFGLAPRNVLGHETKRRRDNYQEMVMCPGGETNEFTMGVDTWRAGPRAVLDKFIVLNDLGMTELLGFLTPAVLIGIGGYLYLRGDRG